MTPAGEDDAATIDIAAADALAGAVGRPVVAVGVDLVDVARIERAVARTAGFVDRAFTADEQDWAASGGGRAAERYALRWAVKEATMKALGVGLGSVALTDVEVHRRPDGAPELVLHGRAATSARRIGVGSWLVSGTHTATLAHAVVLGLADVDPDPA